MTYLSRPGYSSSSQAPPVRQSAPSESPSTEYTYDNSVFSGDNNRYPRTTAGSSYTQRPSTVDTQYNDNYSLSTATDQMAHIDIDEEPEKTIPCLMIDLVDCNEYFSEYKVQAWYDHSLTHFGSRGPPKRSLCIFCDAEFAGGDRREAWKNRMTHIWKHFLNGSDYEYSWPDIDVTKYLYKHGKISREDFEHAMSGGASIPPEVEAEEPQASNWQPQEYVEQDKDRQRRENEIREPEGQSRHGKEREHSKHSRRKHKSSSSTSKSGSQSKHHTKSQKVDVYSESKRR